MPEPVVRVENVTRTYHVGDVDVHALRGVSLTVERGEFVAIMGSSGSGKSTLMSILGCLDRPTSGRYLFEGVDVAQLSEPELARIRSERLGFVFQSFNLLARTSAIENVALPLFYAAVGTVAAEPHALERARAALALVGLRRASATRPASSPAASSSAWRSRARSINAPSLLLADEPTGNLDTRTSHEHHGRRCGRSIASSASRSSSSRTRPTSPAYADRVVTMRDGQIVSDEKQSQAMPSAVIARGRAAPLPTHTAASGATRPAAPTGTIWAFGLMIAAAALQALARNKMRSALTMLGVFIGVAALIAMVAVGQGANEAVRKQIESLGTNLLVVVPGAARMGGFARRLRQRLHADRRRRRGDSPRSGRRSAASAI